LRAAEPDNLGAVREVPADVAVYASLMRNREQVELIGKSNAWKKITELKAFDQAFLAVQGYLNSPQVAGMMQVPENQQLIELLTDMASDEMFVAYGANYSEFAHLYMQINTVNLVGNFKNGMRGQQQFQPIQPGGRPVAPPPPVAGGPPPETKAMLDLMAKNLNAVKVPDMVIGFRLKETDKALAQLKRLDDFATALAAQMGVAGKVKRAKIANGDFLTLSLDGSMVPWQQFPLKQMETKPGEYDALQKRLQEAKLSVSIGIRGKYVLLAVGESTEFLTKFGQGQSLADVPEMKPVVNAVNQRLTSITYMSKAYHSRVTYNTDQFDMLLGMNTDALRQLPVKPELRDRIKKDLNGFGSEVKRSIPKAGATLSYGFLNSRGTEGFSYDYAENRVSDGSKTLSLLNHAGGNPLIFAAGRSKYMPEEWTKFTNWVKLAWSYIEEGAVPNMPPNERPKFEAFVKDAKPLFARFEEITAKELLPALADGQGAIVVDAKLKSKQWFAQLLPSDKPLPMFEVAFVFGVSDAPLLAKACNDYRITWNDLVAAMQKQAPAPPKGEKSPLDNLLMPEPETQKLERGTGYFFRLPPSWDLDRQIVPNAGLSDRVAVVSMSQKHTERLLKPTPLQVNGGPLGDLKRPLSGASYINWAGFVEVIEAWSDYGFVKYVPQAQAAEFATTAQTLLNVLKVFKSTTSATYIADGATVTHSETIIVDLPQ
jgi:hypothetical protein